MGLGKIPGAVRLPSCLIQTVSVLLSRDRQPDLFGNVDTTRVPLRAGSLEFGAATARLGLGCGIEPSLRLLASGVVWFWGLQGFEFGVQASATVYMAR